MASTHPRTDGPAGLEQELARANKRLTTTDAAMDIIGKGAWYSA